MSVLNALRGSDRMTTNGIVYYNFTIDARLEDNVVDSTISAPKIVFYGWRGLEAIVPKNWELL